jgi:hypothetical protein
MIKTLRSGEIRCASREASVPIAKRTTFNAGHVSGHKFAEPVEAQRSVLTGELPKSWQQRLYAKPVTYVVFSYGTPIGWEHADGELVIPDVSYSVTTSQHQGQVRSGFGLNWGLTDNRPETAAALEAQEKAKAERFQQREAKRKCSVCGSLYSSQPMARACEAKHAGLAKIKEVS